MAIFIYLFCLCPLGLTIKLNFNISESGLFLLHQFMLLRVRSKLPAKFSSKNRKVLTPLVGSFFFVRESFFSNQN